MNKCFYRRMLIIKLFSAEFVTLTLSTSQMKIYSDYSAPHNILVLISRLGYGFAVELKKTLNGIILIRILATFLRYRGRK